MHPGLAGKKILVAALNWGLGHATRCMPLIDKLVACGSEVYLAGDGESLRLLEEAYPGLPAHELAAYQIRYPAGWGGAWKTAFQAPRIIRAIRQEQDMTSKLVSKYGFDAIISDNRYGVYSTEVPSVFLCHQLRVLPPKSLRWGAPVVFFFHKSFFGRFRRVWIPDNAGSDNLSGVLSHGVDTGMPTFYIGPQSRFVGLHADPVSADPAPVVALLSGPEPQRSFMEEVLTRELMRLNEPSILIRGVVQPGEPVQTGWLKKVNYLHKEELFQVLSQAKWIVCRSGYSTLMDLSLLHKKAVLIPTAGQTEQEYLAENLARQKKAILQKQDKVDLVKAGALLSAVESVPFARMDTGGLDAALEDLAALIRR